ncbi:MAG: transposase [Succinivibrionaceae bacterium]
MKVISLSRFVFIKGKTKITLKIKRSTEVEAELKKFHWLASHSRILVFKELAHKIRRHLKHILNTIKYLLNSAKVESITIK